MKAKIKKDKIGDVVNAYAFLDEMYIEGIHDFVETYKGHEFYHFPLVKNMGNCAYHISWLELVYDHDDPTYIYTNRFGIQFRFFKDDENKKSNELWAETIVKPAS